MPDRQANDVNAELLYTSQVVKLPSVDRTTFTDLLKIISGNALILTKSGD